MSDYLGPFPGPHGHRITWTVEGERKYRNQEVYGLCGRIGRAFEEYVQHGIQVLCHNCFSAWREDLSADEAVRLCEYPHEALRMAEGMTSQDPDRSARFRGIAEAIQAFKVAGVPVDYAQLAGRTCGEIRDRTCGEIRDERIVREVMES